MPGADGTADFAASVDGDGDGDESTTYDVVVIGSGCSGLFCARALLERGARILVLDEGAALDERDRYDALDAACGVGGAGLFSDGKFSFWPSGQQLNLLVGAAQADRLRAAFDEVVEVLRTAGGMPAMDFPADAFRAPDPLQPAWTLKSYPSLYLDLARRQAIVRRLFEPICASTRLHARVTSVDLRSWPHRVHVTPALPRSAPASSRGSSAPRAQLLRARRLVLAGGRFAMLLPGLESLRTRFRRLEFGVRLQVPCDRALFTRHAETDVKLICQPTDTVQYRTFCVCRHGEIVGTRVAGLHTVSGRADGPPTECSNVALLCRLTDAARAARLADELLARCRAPASLFVLPLARVLQDDDGAAGERAGLRTRLGAEAASLVRGGLQRLVQAYPDLVPSGSGDADDAEAAPQVHGIALEGVGWYAELGPQLQARACPTVSVVGDASGVFRGIVPSMVSGTFVGRLLEWTEAPSR